MVYTFDDAKAPPRHTTQYFELVRQSCHLQRRLDGKYYAELYNTNEDNSQANHLVDKFPDKLKELQATFEVEAKKYNVYPLDSSFCCEIYSA